MNLAELMFWSEAFILYRCVRACVRLDFSSGDALFLEFTGFFMKPPGSLDPLES